MCVIRIEHFLGFPANKCIYSMGIGELQIKTASSHYEKVAPSYQHRELQKYYIKLILVFALETANGLGAREH